MEGITSVVSEVRDTGAAKAGRPGDHSLRDVCREFEGLMLGFVLKESFAGETGDAEDAFPGKDVFMEFALEQTAREIGRSEATGLAAMLYQQLNKDAGKHGQPVGQND